MNWSIERLTAALRHASINPDGHGERIGESREEHVARILERAEIERIVRDDVAVNWPRIEAEREALESEILNAIPCQDLGREEIDL